MATEHISTQEKSGRERLGAASMEGCYLGTLLAVIETMFEEIDSECDLMPENYRARIRVMARQGLDLTYMAQDKTVAIRALTDEIDWELFRAERRWRAEQPSSGTPQ